MGQPARSRRFFGPLLATNPPSVIFSSPTGFFTRIGLLSIVNETIANQTVRFWVGSGPVPETCLFKTVIGTTASSHLLTGIVLEPGDDLWCGVAALGVNVTVSGHGFQVIDD